MLPEVFAFELAAYGLLVTDGAWLAPSFVAGLALNDTDVAAIYLAPHFAPWRRDRVWLRGLPVASARRGSGRMDRRIWQDSDWLAAEAQRRGFPVLNPLPFETLDTRVAYALGIGRIPVTD